jgi:hypothetical protein
MSRYRGTMPVHNAATKRNPAIPSSPAAAPVVKLQDSSIQQNRWSSRKAEAHRFVKGIIPKKYSHLCSLDGRTRCQVPRWSARSPWLACMLRIRLRHHSHTSHARAAVCSTAAIMGILGSFHAPTRALTRRCQVVRFLSVNCNRKQAKGRNCTVSLCSVSLELVCSCYVLLGVSFPTRSSGVRISQGAP